MYFRKLELIGFKSFLEKTEINFEPGITAVVGPNGCGKTNISDAIRWVLGETSARSLRGQRMEDVIFNGTEVHKPLSLAEVSLTLNNEDKIIPIEYSEVTVTRRCYREGESEYLINKNLCRLRDIQELFMDTGIGTESYSIIEQGKVDLILSSRPEDRRFVLEEAAGIAKYNARRDAALRKLELTNQNLLRIDDIIAEVKREIISIKRQVTKAEKYKASYERLKNLETNVGLKKYGAIKAETKIFEDKINLIKEDAARLNVEVAHEESKEEVLHLKLIDTEKAISLARDKFLAAVEAFNNIENRTSTLKERMGHINSRKEEASLEITAIKEKVGEIQKRIERETIEERTVLEDFKGVESRLTEREKAFTALRAVIEANEKELEGSKDKLLEKAREITSLTNETEKIDINLMDVERRLARLSQENQKRECEEKEISLKIDTIKKNISERNTVFTSASEKIKSLEKNIEELNREAADIKKTLEEYSHRNSALISRLSLLTEWDNAHENYGRSITAIFKELEKSGQVVSLIPGLIRIEAGLSLRARKEEIKVLREKAREASEALTVFQKKFLEIEEERARLEKERESSSALLKGEEILVMSEKMAREMNEEGLRRFMEEQRNTSLELKDLEEEKRRLNSILIQKRELVASLEKERECLKVEFDKSAAQFETVKIDFEKAREEKEKANLSFTALREKHSGIELHLRTLRERFSEYNQNIARLEEEITRAQSECENIGATAESLSREKEKFLKEKESFKGEMDRLEDERKKASNIFHEEEERLRKERATAGKKLEELHKCEITITQMEAQLNNLKERLLNLYQVDLDSATGEDVINEDEAKIEIENLHKSLEAMGSVNIMALEENKELEERFSLLKREREDIIKAREELHQVITKINYTCRTLFSETLEKIRAQFYQIFRLLFNGGKADLILQEGDILETGIEIVAKPPGKNLATINQMSGGEKALTAIALLFALFRIKPSPFCVLDEIDAPLDDSNVGRYGALLKEFLKSTQFIIITHNKKTISLANIIYGITMEEPGISKIVSVKFQDSHATATVSP